MARSYKKNPICKQREFDKKDNNRAFRRQLNRGQYDNLITHENNLFKYSKDNWVYRKYYSKETVLKDVSSTKKLVQSRNSSKIITKWYTVHFDQNNQIDLYNKDVSYHEDDLYNGLDYDSYKEKKLQTWAQEFYIK